VENATGALALLYNLGVDIEILKKALANFRGIKRRYTKHEFPNGKIYNGYFYNRSHLIADSLGGRSYKYNVVTGTRQQNVGNNGDGGMQSIEKKEKQLKSGPEWALYNSFNELLQSIIKNP